MEYSDISRIYDDAVINTITSRVIDAITQKLEKMKEQESSPYVSGIDGLASFLGIGETLAQEMKNKNEIPYSQRGKKIWFKKSEIEKFMQRHRV